MDPVERYRNLHQNSVNKAIHMLCVPVIYMCCIAHLPVSLGIISGLIYALVYFVRDLEKKSPNSAVYTIVLTFFGLLLGQILPQLLILGLHVVSWIAQFVGHFIFEKNRPALMTSFVESLLWAPYIMYYELLSVFS